MLEKLEEDSAVFYINNRHFLYSNFKGLVYRRTQVTPQLNDHHKLQRLAWCLANQNNDFLNYVFIDETLIRIEELPLYHITEKGVRTGITKVCKKERQNFNVWGGISFCGATEFVGFEINMNGAIYCDILHKYLLPFVYADGNDGNMIAHQDNASTHTGNLAQTFLNNVSLVMVNIK